MQEPERQGYLSLKTISEHILNVKEPKQEKIYTQISIVTSECLD